MQAIYCPNCGTQRQEGMRYCASCRYDFAPANAVTDAVPRQAPTERRALARSAMQVQTISLLTGLGGLVGLLGGGALWLWLLYEPLAVNGDLGLVWFLGAIGAALVGGLLGRYAIMALLAR